MRSVSSAMNLRKVHAKKEAERSSVGNVVDADGMNAEGGGGVVDGGEGGDGGGHIDGAEGEGDGEVDTSMT